LPKVSREWNDSPREQEDNISILQSITGAQLIESFLAIPAFAPVTVFPGYVTAWFTNLHGFRRRTFVERLFWSVPLSIGISTISSVLISRFLSLTTAAISFSLCGVIFLGCLGWEWFCLHRTGAKWPLGFHPFGGIGIALAFAWTALSILSLIDFQRGQQLFLSLTFFDHGSRVNWADAVLRTGLPPNNPLYFFEHAANLRYYYFWLVDCAVIARITQFPMRVIVIASCIWSGFSLAALVGLYLKHFLQVGARLRKQFLVSIGLLAITGPYIVVDVWDIFILHKSPPGIEVWPEGQITSWIDNFYFYPHHVASVVCCMLAFLLAWMAKEHRGRVQLGTAVMIGVFFASAFGLSIYVAFAFFLVMLVWGIWHLAVERGPKQVSYLAAGGVLAAVLLLPYLQELTQGSSRVHGGHVFGYAIRETISPAGLLALPIFRNIAIAHPGSARAFAKLILMIPGYAVELGFYFVVVVALLVPRWRAGKPLNSAQRALLVLAFATFPFISFIRSEVLTINDFGIHGGMFVEFPLLLLASDFVIGWSRGKHRSAALVRDPEDIQAPLWLTSGAKVCMFLGALSTVYIAAILRFGILALPDVRNGTLAHKAYISALGYAQVNTQIARNAIVQFNPTSPDTFWTNIDLANINHQTAITSDQLWCGSELGGDLSGCPAMIAAIPPLFKHATAETARDVCRTYHIDYLVANIYDPAWNDRTSWVWSLNAAVANPEFRALDCQH
jgi:hypothetical protein